MDEAELRRTARDKLRQGELPRLNPERIWINPGSWEPCALCGVPITDSETEYELQFTMRFGLGRTELVSFWFHTACYTTWLDERARP